MSKFKVGDRVRINLPRHRLNGREGTIWKIATSVNWFNQIHPEDVAAHCVDVDGHGRYALQVPTSFLGFPYWELEPLVPPDELAWQKFREHLKPNPAIIFDADPITVSTEHEAEAIADRVPNSHIIVAVYRNGKRIVLSEYYGQSQSNRP